MNGECGYPPATMTCATVSCPSGQICINGACAPQCTTDAQCGSGFYCASGACRVDDRAQPPFCTPPANGCATGSVCINGACHISCSNPMGMDPNTYCMRVDSAFPMCGSYMGQPVCIAAGELNPQCARTSDCPTGQTCINATCH
jgi:Cys-rich repeat protein